MSCVPVKLRVATAWFRVYRVLDLGFGAWDFRFEKMAGLGIRIKAPPGSN